MPLHLLPLNRLQRKLVLIILVIVVVPMLVAGAVTSAWVSSNFEQRLEQWIKDASRVTQTWLQDYQSDALMLGEALADDPQLITSLDDGEIPIHPPLDTFTQKLGINFIQLYSADRRLLYSSTSGTVDPLWENGQTAAVLKLTHENSGVLAAVGITPLPRRGPPRYYLVLGNLLDQEFVAKFSQLTGLKTRLYYREGSNFFDVFSAPGEVLTLKHLPKEALKRLTQDKKPYYSVETENGQFRGQYTPMTDSEGHVEAIVFAGLQRRGFEEVLTNRVVLFLSISLLGAAIGVLAGVLLSLLMVRPIEALRKGVRQLAGQNLNASVPVTSDDELGDLAKAFNAMAQSLRQARDEQQYRFQRDKLIALGELSAALAHEIRNPIGVINTAAGLLEKTEPDSPKHSELTRMVREESTRVSNLVQDFLRLSRYRQPQFAPIDPAAPMRRALDAALAGHNDIRTDLRLTHGAARINADANLLQQAWANLFTNALQAIGGEEGELVLRSSLTDGQVLLSLEDSGPGIPADIMPRLFEPFFTTKDQGTGLGLTIANTLVEANSGRLEVLESQRRGACIGMRFPVYEDG